MAPLSERAFADLHEEASRPLWAYVYRVTGHAADADDIVQEAFCRMLVSDLGGLDAEALRRYLFRVASNLITDRWRRASREQPPIVDFDQQPAARHALEGDLPRTFAQLKPRERALLWLAYVEEESHKDIAAMLRVAPGSVKVLLSRARDRLRTLIRQARLAGEQTP